MKRKIIQATISVLMGYTCIQAFSSYSTGYTASVSCNGVGCHTGNRNLYPGPYGGISGNIPLSGYVPGQIYTMNVGVTGTMPNIKVAGVIAFCSGGTILSAGPGAAVYGTNSIYSTSPQTLVSNSAGWTFVWKADSSKTNGQMGVIFAYSCVFANGNGQADSGDYNVNDGARMVYAQSTGINNLSAITFQTYPVPAHDRLFLSTNNDELKCAYAVSIDGIVHPVSFKGAPAGPYSLDISNLSPGFFRLVIETKTGMGSKSLQKL